MLEQLASAMCSHIPGLCNDLPAIIAQGAMRLRNTKAHTYIIVYMADT